MHDAVTLVVEQRDREALVRSGVLERVEPHEADVLEAAQRSPLDDGVHRLDLVHALRRAHRLLGAADQPVMERAAVLAAHELAVVANGALSRALWTTKPMRSEQHQAGEHAEGEREVIEEEAVEIGHRIGGIIAVPRSPTRPRPAARSRTKPRGTDGPPSRKGSQPQGPTAVGRPARRDPSRGAASAARRDARAAGRHARRRARPSRSSLAAPRRRPRRDARLGSTLTTSERTEYHYVERDLRNIGILTVAMAVLLFLAWFVFSPLGLVG